VPPVVVYPPPVIPPVTIAWVSPPPPTIEVTEVTSPPTTLEITESPEELPGFVAPVRVRKVFRN
jgi:hypothetical protein